MNLGKEFEKYAVKHLGIGSHNVDQYQKIYNNNPNNITPYILEERQLNVTQMSVFDRLMMDRIIFLNESVNDYTMGIVNAQILFLNSIDTKKDIQIYLNTPGGSCLSGLSTCDLMSYVTNDFVSMTMGSSCSMGSILASSATKGKRYILKHSRFMIHNVSSGAQGNLKDMETSFKLSRELRDELFQILADNSGNSVEQIAEWCDRDYWMKSDEAVEKGFLDHVITKQII